MGRNLRRWGNLVLILSPDFAFKSNWMYFLLQLYMPWYYSSAITWESSLSCWQLDHAEGEGTLSRLPGWADSVVVLSLTSAILKCFFVVVSFCFLFVCLFYIFTLFTFPCGNIWTVWNSRLAYFQLEAAAMKKSIKRAWKHCTLYSEFLAFQARTTKASGSCFIACLPLEDVETFRCLEIFFLFLFFVVISLVRRSSNSPCFSI